MTQSKIIIKILESNYPAWVPVYDMMLTETPWGWLGNSADRRCRELRENNIIEVQEFNGFAHYRIRKEKVQGKLL